MTSRDFVYWLQGFFELTEVNQINQKQNIIIRDHLKLVNYYETNINEDQSRSLCRNFIYYLIGYLTIHDKDVTIEGTTEIKIMLNNIFVHEIDPHVTKIDFHQSIMNHIHNGIDDKMRC